MRFVELNTQALQKSFDENQLWNVYETIRVMIELNFKCQTKDDCSNVADSAFDYFQRKCAQEKRFYTIGFLGKLTRHKMLDYIYKKKRDKRNNLKYMDKIKGDEWDFFPEQLKIILSVTCRGKVYSLSI